MSMYGVFTSQSTSQVRQEMSNCRDYMHGILQQTLLSA